MLEIDISRNSSQNYLGVLRGAFLVFGCPKRHPDALLAKTMVCSYPHCEILDKHILFFKIPNHLPVTYRDCVKLNPLTLQSVA